MTDVGDVPAGAYSGGEKRRLSVALGTFSFFNTKIWGRDFLIFSHSNGRKSQDHLFGRTNYGNGSCFAPSSVENHIRCEKRSRSNPYHPFHGGSWYAERPYWNWYDPFFSPFLLPFRFFCFPFHFFVIYLITVARGQLRCIGSNIRLKNKFGTGYQISLFFPATSSDETISRIRAFASSHLPDWESVFDQAATTLQSFTLTVPYSESERMAALLQALEDNAEALGVLEVIMNLSSLEEVS